MLKKDLPYLKLYVQDFMTDEKLVQCSAEANGVYIWIMLLMTKSENYGKLLLKQKFKQTSSKSSSKRQAKQEAKDKHLLQVCFSFANQLSKHLPFEPAKIEGSLHELLDENVLQLEGDWLIQKRMVMDAQISDIRAVVGKKGGKNRVKNLTQKAGNSNEKEEDILLKQNVKQTSSKMSSKTMTSIDNNNYTGNNINNGVKFHEDLDNVPEPVARYYSMSYENLINGGSSISEYVIKGERITVTQEDFEDWKEFVRLCDGSEHELFREIFTAKFIFPKDFACLKRRGFSKDMWLPVLKKILSVGVEQKHNLFFRIPDAIKWLNNDKNNIGRKDQAVKETGSNKTDYSKNDF